MVGQEGVRMHPGILTSTSECTLFSLRSETGGEGTRHPGRNVGRQLGVELWGSGNQPRETRLGDTDMRK